MNKYFQTLLQSGQKKSRRIIGLMSGTSLDGLDIALCRFEGSGLDTKAEIIHFKSVEYPQTLRSKLLNTCFKEMVHARTLTELNTELGRYFGKAVNTCLEEWGVDSATVDCVASHGQTIYHAPSDDAGEENGIHSTLQMGDGDHLAWQAGIPVLSDFRQKHIAAGGQGAPLAAYSDLYLFGREGEHRILLNIGGISNITWLDGSQSFDNVVTTDVGPGNTLINQAVQKYYNNLDYDHEGTIAESGEVVQSLLAELLNHPFYKRPFPKSTGPESFNLEFVEKAQRKVGGSIAEKDIIATLTALTVKSIIKGINATVENGESPEILVSGGGVHNPAIMDGLKSYFGNEKVLSLNQSGIDPDAKEALLFAMLANEYLCGNGLPVPGKENGKSVLLGKISLPA